MSFEIEYRPTKKFVVHSLMNITYEEFLDACTLGNDYGSIAKPVWWTDGIVWQIGYFDSSDSKAQQLWRDGIIHIRYVEYTEMPVYQPSLTNMHNKVILPVIKAETRRWKIFIAWVKEQKDTV